MRDKTCDQAVDLMKKAQYSAAIPLFLEFLESNQDDCSAHYMLGQCYRLNGQLADALKTLKISEELLYVAAYKDDVIMQKSIYLALGIAYQLNEEFDEAVRVFRKGISKCEGAPDKEITNQDKGHILYQDIQLHNSLGLTYKYMNEYHKALEAYIKAREIIISEATKGSGEARQLEDGTKTYHVDPGKTYLKLKSSIQYCNNMSNIGMVYIAMGELESAEKALKESIEFIPEGNDFPPPHEGLTFINSKKK